MNTRIAYRYADKNNCRQYTSVVVEGVITWEQIEPFLYRRNSFIPGQLGLEDLQRRFALPGDDHPWHQITVADIKLTESAPTITITAQQLVERFATTEWAANWGSMPPKAASTAVDASSSSYLNEKDKGVVRMRAAPSRSRKPSSY